MGVRMSGDPSCASTDPSTYSTRECTTLCRCMTTSMRFGRQAKEQAGLYQFQTLVHQRGGIDGNFAPHGPVRMGTGLCRSRILQRCS